MRAVFIFFSIVLTGFVALADVAIQESPFWNLALSQVTGRPRDNTLEPLGMLSPQQEAFAGELVHQYEHLAELYSGQLNFLVEIIASDGAAPKERHWFSRRKAPQGHLSEAIELIANLYMENLMAVGHARNLGEALPRVLEFYQNLMQLASRSHPLAHDRQYFVQLAEAMAPLITILSLEDGSGQPLAGSESLSRLGLRIFVEAYLAAAASSSVLPGEFFAYFLGVLQADVKSLAGKSSQCSLFQRLDLARTPDAVACQIWRILVQANPAPQSRPQIVSCNDLMRDIFL